MIAATFVLFGNIALIKAYKTEDISIINILTRTSLIIAFISGIILFNESINIIKIFGILSIIFGILVIFYEGKKLKLSDGLLLALASGISIGLIVYFRKIALDYVNPISYLFIFGIFINILLLLIPKTRQDIKPIWAKYKKKIVPSRFTGFAAWFLFVWAFQKGNISIVNTNYETAFLLSTLLIGIGLMGEKNNITKKLAGSLFCTLGIILLNFF